MINKRNFIFNTLAEAYKYKIGEDSKNTTYRQGSFSANAEIKIGEPDISYYSAIFIRETNQMWQCGQFWLNDIQRDPDNDLATEHAERMAADSLLQQSIDALVDDSESCKTYQQKETEERTQADAELKEYIENQNSAIASLGLRVDNLAMCLITMDEYRAISPKSFQTYYVARDEADKAKMKCWRIYLRTQLIGEFESSGKLTIPKFPMRFPFRFS